MMTVLPISDTRRFHSNNIDWITPLKDKARVTYEVPQDLPTGFYTVRFLGSIDKQPSLSECDDLDPYRVWLIPGQGNAGERQDTPSFTFCCPGENVIDINELAEPYRNPTPVTWRQTSRPFYLIPKDTIQLEFRYPYTLAAQLSFIPVAPDACLDIAIKGAAEHHVFTDRCPPRFDISIKNWGKATCTHSLQLTVGDALTGETQCRTIPLSIEPEARQTLSEGFEVLNGVYYLTVDTLNADGQVVTRHWRHFSYSPHIDAHDLPMDWPFGFHLKEEDPMPPPVGLKWMRIFRPGWYELQREEEALDWSSFDYQVERCKAAGHPILFIGLSTPRWAWPGSPEGFRAFAKNPATKPGAFEAFLRAFWERYAPNGKLDTVRAIEIFNEPNAHDTFRYEYEKYVSYAKLIYETTKEMAPDAIVAGISLSGGMHEHFVQGVLDAGLGQYMDIASLHLYESGAPLGAGHTMEAKMHMFKKQMAAHRLEDMPLWDTESGARMSIRNAGVMLPQEHLNAFYRNFSSYNPARPWVVNNFWVGVSESLVTAWMIRASLQQLAAGIKTNFYFQWTNSVHGWVSDWGPDGNPMPRLKIPAQAVLSQLWRDYAGLEAETLTLPSPDPEFWLLAFRFKGPKGTMTALYTHPFGADRGSEDEVSTLATGTVVTYEKPPVRYEPFSRREAPQSIDVNVPVSSSEAVVLDWLDRKRESLTAHEGHVTVSVDEYPVYILEPNPKV